MNYTKEDYARCKAIANEIFRQIIANVGKWVYFSWGVSKMHYGFYNDMPTLMMRVSGVIHKGWVYISLDEGRDVYVVTLLNVPRKKVKGQRDEVYCDEIGNVIDSMVERDPELSDELYKRKAMADSRRKGF